MRILFITNYYSPARYGWGYRQLCEEVADGLAAIGHALAVLTSTHRNGPEPPRPYPVHRLLHIEPDWESPFPAAWQFFAGRRRRERQAVAHLRRLLTRFRPEAIMVWHAIGLPRAMLQVAEQEAAGPVVYYLADYQPEIADEYLQYWQNQAHRPAAALFKRMAAPLALKMLAKEGKPVPIHYDNVICVSDYVRRRLVSKNLISPQAVVIHNGVNLAQFSPSASPLSFANGLRCLVMGRLVAEKGIHTVIEAFARLDSGANVTLTLLGDGPAAYRRQLRQQIQRYRLQDTIRFQPPVPREQIPDVLSRYNTLLFPSEYDEPLARAMQEAMAKGLLVIGTTTGGSGELLSHRQTGLVFEAGNPRSLAEQLRYALEHPAVAAELAQAGRREVVENFNIERTVRRIEAYLAQVRRAWTVRHTLRDNSA
ncbi:MAG: glycosyltransferase family 1 protein [Caldilineae bacterium]|nr:MAG: glycosyltransferase family 1 protein [Caldilineae bacterium]